MADEPEIARRSLQVDDISFASSSQLSYTIKNLDMESIIKHRHGHHVTFQSSVKKPAVDANNIGVDDVSMMSSSSMSSTMRDILSRKKDGSPKKLNADVELDLPSDGASTFRDFDPRDVKHIEKQINMRDREKQERIGFKTGDLTFADRDIKPLLGLIPKAYEQMAQMPYFVAPGDAATAGKPTRSQIKSSVNKIEELLEQLGAIQLKMNNL